MATQSFYILHKEEDSPRAIGEMAAPEPITLEVLEYLGFLWLVALELLNALAALQMGALACKQSSNRLEICLGCADTLAYWIAIVKTFLFD